MTDSGATFTHEVDDVVSEAERDTLLSLDDPYLASTRHTCADRCVPLGVGRWAVGRGTAEGTRWRLVNGDGSGPAGHPAWLWTVDAWFEPGEGPDTLPEAVPLREQLQRAAPLVKVDEDVRVLLAATVAALRAEPRRPIAVVVDEAQLAEPEPARWFLLAMLTALPEPMRALAVAAGESPMRPERWDVVVTALPLGGFHLVDAANARSQIEGDPVATWLLAQLEADDVESVEAASWLWEDTPPAPDPEEEAPDESDESVDPATGDPWRRGIEARLAPAFVQAPITGDMITMDPHSTADVVLDRLQAGSQLDGELAAAVAELTVRTGSPMLFRALEERSLAERRRAARAWMQLTRTEPPPEAVLRAIGTVRPPGTASGSWASALLACVGDGPGRVAARELLLDLVETEPLPNDPAVRASLFSEIVLQLVTDRRNTAATDAFLAPAARRLAHDGAGQALAHTWLVVPPAAWSEANMRDLVVMLSEASDADLAVTALYTGVEAMRHFRYSALIVEVWAAVSAARGPHEGDRLLPKLRGTANASVWARTIGARARPDALTAFLTPVTEGSHDPLWREAEHARATAGGLEGRARLVAMETWLPGGAEALEPVARGLLTDLVASGTRFPDRMLAEVAVALAEVPEASTIWMWLAVSAAPVGRHADDTIDATVAAFCDRPPRNPANREAAVAAATALGSATGWTAYDHAAWIVRLVVSADGDGSGFNVRLAAELVEAISQREDGVDRMTKIANEVLELPRGHYAVRVFVKRLLPRAFPTGAPSSFVRDVRSERLPRDLEKAWDEAVTGV